MKRIIAYLMICLLVFSTMIAASAAPAEEDDLSVTAAETVEEIAETAEDPTEPSTEVSTEAPTEAPTEEPTEEPTEAPTEPPTEPEPSPYRDSVPKVTKVNFSSGNYENTLTLYTDTSDDGQYDFMKRYGNHYRWYYKSDNGWTRIGTTTENSFTWYPTERGRNYTFTVRCTDRTDKRFISDFDRTGYTMYYCRTPGSLKATVEIYGVRFTFDKCYGAKKYAIYRKIEGGWKRIAVTTNGYYFDRNANPNTVNTYTVRCINDKENVFWSNFKHAGVSVSVRTFPDVKAGRSMVNKLLKHIADDIAEYPNGRYARPGIYWEESSIPSGADWCTGFAHYVLNKGLNGYYACQWNNIKASPSYWHPYTDVWSKNANTAGIFYKSAARSVPTAGDIVFFRKRDKEDTFANIGHVGLVYKVYDDGSIDTLEGNVNVTDGKTTAFETRTRVIHYKKSGKTWINDKRTVSGFIDLDKIIKNGEKYNK